VFGTGYYKGNKIRGRKYSCRKSGVYCMAFRKKNRIPTHKHTHIGGLRQFLAMIVSTGRRDISVWGLDRQFGEKS